MSIEIRQHVRWVPSVLNLADAPGRNQVADIKSHFSTSALAQLSDLCTRDVLLNEAEAKRKTPGEAV